MLQDNTNNIIDFQEFSDKIKEIIKPYKTPFIIGVAGGSGSGKSFIAQNIAKEFQALLIKMDDYYIRDPKITNKDAPNALNLKLLKQNLSDLHKRKEIEKPVYTFRLHKDHKEIIKPSKIIILEGLFALNSIFINQIDLKIFVDADEKIRFERRLERDTNERGYPKEHTIKRWQETVEPMYQKYVLPQKNKADLIIKNS